MEEPNRRLNRLGVGALLLTGLYPNESNPAFPGLNRLGVGALLLTVAADANYVGGNIRSQSPRCRRTSSYRVKKMKEEFVVCCLNRLGVGALLLTLKEGFAPSAPSLRLNRLGSGALLLTTTTAVLLPLGVVTPGLNRLGSGALLLTFTRSITRIRCFIRLNRLGSGALLLTRR